MMLNDIYQTLDPVAFRIGDFAIRWYGIGYILGIAIAGFLVMRIAKRWRIDISTDNLLTIIIAATAGIIFGGRLGYVLFYGFEYYSAHPAEILMFANGGMSFHGGVIGMVIAMIIVARITHMPALTLGDLAVITAPVGIFLVRITNFINGELWGAVTNLPWGVVFGGSAGNLPRHPTQLYEAILEGLVIFVVLSILSRKNPPRPRGAFLGVFMVLYGVFRIAIEFVREPDIQLGYLYGGWITMGMVLSLPLIIAGVAFLVFAATTKLPQQGSSARAFKDEEACDESGDELAGESDDEVTGESDDEVTGESDDEPSTLFVMPEDPEDDHIVH
jgi:phosphatidylglycerol:prolipoprotein diacylglycerol transferase